MNRLCYRLYNRIYVLMSPEVRYFSEFGEDKVCVLPYSGPAPEIDMSPRLYCPEMIWGNSCWSLSDYRGLLERVDGVGVRRIVCMLNYGMEDAQANVDDFVAEAQAKYGEAFYAWRTTLPLEEYREVMKNPAFYVCASKTQTGLGAISLSIRQGKTLLLRGDNYQWISSLGIKAYDLDNLDDLSEATLRKLFLTEAEQRQNKETWLRCYQSVYNEQRWIEQIKEGFGIFENA